MRFLFILVTLSVLGIGSVQAQDTKGARYDNSKKPKQLTPEQEAQAEFDKLPAEQKRVLLEVQEEIEREKYSDTKKNKGVKKPEKKDKETPLPRSGAAAVTEVEEQKSKKDKSKGAKKVATEDAKSTTETSPAETKETKATKEVKPVAKEKSKKPTKEELEAFKNTTVHPLPLKHQLKPNSKTVAYNEAELKEFSLYVERISPFPDSADVAVLIPKVEPAKANEAKLEKAIDLVQTRFPDKALSILNELHKAEPKNANIQYWLGRAYLECYNTNEKATSYLAKAAEHTDFNYVYKNPEQNKLAPLDALFYTAISYFRNSQFKEADRFLRLYIGVTKEKNDPLKTQAELALLQLANAEKMVKEPKRSVSLANLGPNINTPYADYGAYATLDGTELYFTSARAAVAQAKAKKGAIQLIDYANAKFQDDIFVATLSTEGTWADAKTLGLVAVGNKSVKGISANSRNLWLLKDDDFNIDFYETSYGFDTWQAETSLSPYSITLKWGKNFSVSADKTVIYFATNQLPGYGGYDIFYVVRQFDGSWSEPMNVGPNVNTAWDEDMPFLHPNARVLYFSSNSPRSMGGFDVFRSLLIGEWQTPENMGYPINSVGDDLYFTIAPDGRTGYISKQEKGGQGDLDIYQINFFSYTSALPPRLQANFKIDLKKEDKNAKGAGTQIENETNEIVLTNILSREQFTYVPNFRTGNFSVYLDPCTKYNIEYRKNGQAVRTEDFIAPCEDNATDNTLRYDPTVATAPQKVNRLVPLVDKREANLQGYGWQLQRNGQPVIYMALKPVNYLNAKGEIIKTVKLDSEGIFPFEEIPGDQDYIFELELDEENTCNQFKVVMVKDRKRMPINYSYSVVCYR